MEIPGESSHELSKNVVRKNTNCTKGVCKTEYSQANRGHNEISLWQPFDWNSPRNFIHGNIPVNYGKIVGSLMFRPVLSRVVIFFPQFRLNRNNLLFCTKLTTSQIIPLCHFKTQRTLIYFYLL